MESNGQNALASSDSSGSPALTTGGRESLELPALGTSPGGGGNHSHSYPLPTLHTTVPRHQEL